VIAAGSGLLPITNGPVHVEGNFETNADLTIAAADVSFGRDLRVNGEILAIGKVRVAGDVYQTPGHAGANVVGAGGEVRIQDFVVPTPCACGKGDVLDIEAIVADGMADNHNQKLGVSDDVLHTVTGAGALTLECGRYAVKGGKVLAGTAIEARGRVALFVAGDLTIAGKFAAQLGPDAEADVFVSGNLILVEGAEIGSLARPAALRFYVSGQGDIAVTGPLSFAANLYAPRASVYFTVDQESYGALFVEAYQGIADHVMHYDRAIARAGSMRASTCAH